MSAIIYPETEPNLDTAALRGEATLRTCVTVRRSWRSAADALDVDYYRDPAGSDQWWAAVNDLQVPLNRPLKLSPVTVDKPWGVETWYTGIEARGESSVITPDGTLPLLSYLSLAPDRLCGRQAPVLLKSLTSRPEPVIGELYFEIHEHKQEVYVVSKIDRRVYPDGIGVVRFGMNQQLRAGYPNDDEFRQAFLNTVQAYERETRNQSTAAANSETRNQLLQFINLESLREGDSLVVPSGVPHSLQPGLSVFEFQTPSYERQIIFASQPVITQRGWDSSHAIAAMSVDPADPPRSAGLGDPAIASLNEFGVRRITVNGSNAPLLQADLLQADLLPEALPYAIALAADAAVTIVCAGQTLTLDHGEAAFIPGSARGLHVRADQPTALLLSGPGL